MCNFNVNTRCYGFGGFVNNNGNKYYFSGPDNEESLVSMQNVTGKILGAIEAVKVVKKLGLKNLCIYYDYKDIEEWTVGNWKANGNGTINYQRFMNSPERTVNICFKKIKGYSGVEGNKITDMLARYPTGISITKKEKSLIAEWNVLRKNIMHKDIQEKIAEIRVLMLFALAIAGSIFIDYYREYPAFSGAISLFSLIIYALMFILEVVVLSKKQKRSQKILKKDESLKKENIFKLLNALSLITEQVHAGTPRTLTIEDTIKLDIKNHNNIKKKIKSRVRKKQRRREREVQRQLMQIEKKKKKLRKKIRQERIRQLMDDTKET